MKYLVTTALMFSAMAAQAEVLDAAIPQDEIIYMSLGRAPYNGVTRGSLELKNTGAKNLTQIVWDISGMGFSAQDNCPKELVPGKACKIFVTYWNTFPGPASGTLKVWTSDKNYKVQVSAWGEEDPFRNIPRPPTPPFPRRP